MPGVSLASAQLAAISQWVDTENRHVDARALDMIRLHKLGEELGETLEAYSLAYGFNPRKRLTASHAPLIEHVQRELLDVALTALAAWEHFAGHPETAISALINHIDTVWQRTQEPTP